MALRHPTPQIRFAVPATGVCGRSSFPAMQVTLVDWRRVANA
jgi:hypothetical protein